MIAGVSSVSTAAFHSVSGTHRPSAGSEASGVADANELTEEQQQEVERLKERDREVRAHEQAHARAGGQYAGAPSYEYERGPDGHLYAVSGEVQIDAAPIANDPAATIVKMDIVIRAALAPQEPSAQDSRVASEARATKADARADLREQTQEEATEAAEGLSYGGDSAHTQAAAAYESAGDLISDIAEYAFSTAA